MIPSTPRRTLLFLVASTLAFFLPDLLVPARLAAGPGFSALSAAYQAVVLVAGFWFAPAICRAMMAQAAPRADLVHRVDLAARSLQPPARVPVVAFEHRLPFMLTAGLLPGRSTVFVSSGKVAALGAAGLRFALGRAQAHAGWDQRFAAVTPVLALTLALPDTPNDAGDWGALGLLLLAWLVLHWRMELRADGQAARMAGADAGRGLAELLALGGGQRAASLMPPARWRRHRVEAVTR